MIHKFSFIMISILSSLTCLILSTNLNAQSTEFFTSPQGKDMEPATYPRIALLEGQEGVVTLNFMVDTQGAPFETIVRSRRGPSSLERAALRALNDSIFTPATLNGEAIESSYTFQYRFNIDGETGARLSFTRKYRAFSSVYETKNENEIQNKFEELIEHETKNHYEYAFLNLAKYFHATLQGSSFDQMTYLEQALNFNPTGRDLEIFLSKEYETTARRALFRLQVNNNRYFEAIANFKIMESNEDIEGVAMNKELFDVLLGVREDETAYPIYSQLDNNGSWHFHLFKNQFYFDQIEGAINEIKLRCETKFGFFLFDSALDYNIPDSWGDCMMEVIGERDTSFRLVQL